MQEIYGDLFDSELADAICITTNGFVNSQGAATMGAGCAGKAKALWPGIQMALGYRIKTEGHQVHQLTNLGRMLPGSIYGGWPDHQLPYHLLAFPTKPVDFDDPLLFLPKYRINQKYDGPWPGWMAQSDPHLILRSCHELKTWVDGSKWESVVLPRPGCGYGGLDWEETVRPIVSAVLDERFYVISPSRE